MKTLSVSPVLLSTNPKPSIKNSKNTNQKFENHNCDYGCYPSNYYLQSFKGANIAKMYEEYNWYINKDNLPAIKSFLKMIAPKEEMDEFLTHILRTDDRSYQLIDSIVNIPREAKEIYNKLCEKVGRNSKNVMIFLPDSPYNDAYTKYIREKYNRANTLSELLHVRPDWSGDALMKKYINLTGNTDLKIGNAPKHIQKGHLNIIIDYLKKKMEIGMKSNKQIDDLILDGRTYKFEYFTEGKSSKNVFGFHVPYAGRKYIIKIDYPEKRSLDEPFALGTLAKIDEYLTANRCRNSAPICYYDHKNNFSIYKYIEHFPVEDQCNNLPIIQKHLPDFKALGMDYNDTVGYQNFFTLEALSSDTHHRTEGFQNAIGKQEWISVDNDHVTYNNIFQPSVRELHRTLPNAMGMFF